MKPAGAGEQARMGKKEALLFLIKAARWRQQILDLASAHFNLRQSAPCQMSAEQAHP